MLECCDTDLLSPFHRAIGHNVTTERRNTNGAKRCHARARPANQVRNRRPNKIPHGATRLRLAAAGISFPWRQAASLTSCALVSFRGVAEQPQHFGFVARIVRPGAPSVGQSRNQAPIASTGWSAWLRSISNRATPSIRSRGSRSRRAGQAPAADQGDNRGRQFRSARGPSPGTSSPWPMGRSVGHYFECGHRPLGSDRHLVTD